MNGIVSKQHTRACTYNVYTIYHNIYMYIILTLSVCGHSVAVTILHVTSCNCIIIIVCECYIPLSCLALDGLLCHEKGQVAPS